MKWMRFLSNQFLILVRDNEMNIHMTKYKNWGDTMFNFFGHAPNYDNDCNGVHFFLGITKYAFISLSHS